MSAAVNDATAGDYPAWNWVKSYVANNGLSGTYASGWYMPIIAELTMLYRAKATVNAVLTAIGGQALSSYYWSSSQSATRISFAWGLDVTFGDLASYYKTINSTGVCCICAFN